jgi:hypothetical protein
VLCQNVSDPKQVPCCSLSAKTQNLSSNATTRAAALRITSVSNMGSPTNVHSAMNLPTKGPLLRLQQNLLNQVDNKRDVRDNLVKPDFVLCEKMFMLTNTLLQMMLHRTRMITLANMKPKILVLVGDRSQLPPICIHCGKHSMDDTEELGDYSSHDDENENIANISILHEDKVEAQNPNCELCHIMYSSTMREAIVAGTTLSLPWNPGQERAPLGCKFPMGPCTQVSLPWPGPRAVRRYP